MSYLCWLAGLPLSGSNICSLQEIKAPHRWLPEMAEGWAVSVSVSQAPSFPAAWEEVALTEWRVLFFLIGPPNSELCCLSNSKTLFLCLRLGQELCGGPSPEARASEHRSSPNSEAVCYKRAAFHAELSVKWLHLCVTLACVLMMNGWVENLRVKHEIQNLWQVLDLIAALRWLDQA